MLEDVIHDVFDTSTPRNVSYNKNHLTLNYPTTEIKGEEFFGVSMWFKFEPYPDQAKIEKNNK